MGHNLSTQTDTHSPVHGLNTTRSLITIRASIQVFLSFGSIAVSSYAEGYL
jgi:hypothetical protein